MKNTIKKIIPPNIWNGLKNKQKRIELHKLYVHDEKKYVNSAFNLTTDISFENLRARITYHYHAIEKGLSNSNLRLGFGKRAFKQLFISLDEYILKGYPTDDNRFQSALSVINTYITIHQRHEHSVEDVEKNFLRLRNLLLPEKVNIGGAKQIFKEDLPNFNTLPFNELANNRFSVRDFGEESIKDTDVMEAIQIATKSPSVCNRQSSSISLIKNSGLITKILEIQGGFKASGENVENILLITSNNKYMNGPNERNQTYIDGGLFTMSLLYALESKGIASCTLNAAFDINREKEVKRLLNLQHAEDLIAFIAIGSYPDIIRIAKSSRDDAETITTIY